MAAREVESGGLAVEGKSGGGGQLSPLTGAYLLIVAGEPASAEHKELIQQRIAKGFLSWESQAMGCDVDKELQLVVDQKPTSEEAKTGERLIQYATENLVTEVLINAQVNTLTQCIKNLLSSYTRHKHVIHAGYAFGGSGSWVLQDGTFSYLDFLDALQEAEVQRLFRACENSVSIHVHCAPEGPWTNTSLSRESCAKLAQITINPTDKSSPLTGVTNFVNYLADFLKPQPLGEILEPSDVVGSIRFSRPTLYVFPGGQGDSALFGVNGFNMLVDGGFSRRACFWDFVRHLDRVDALLVTRLSNSSVGGVSSLLQRKNMSEVYPQIGHVFCNVSDKKQSPDGLKDQDSLVIDMNEENHNIVESLKQLSVKPQSCYRDPNIEPINLYHKVGHGKLDMYVVNPSRDSREVKEFLHQWNAQSHQKPGAKCSDRELTIPLPNLMSICALLVWRPADPKDSITRILFPGSSPQAKIFEGLEKLKHLEVLKHPVCSEKKLKTPTGLKSKKSVPTADVRPAKYPLSRPSPPVKSVDEKPEIKSPPIKSPAARIERKIENKIIDKKAETRSNKLEEKKPAKTEKKDAKKPDEKKIAKRSPSASTMPKKPEVPKTNGITRVPPAKPEVSSRPLMKPKGVKDATNKKTIEAKNIATKAATVAAIKKEAQKKKPAPSSPSKTKPAAIRTGKKPSPASSIKSDEKEEKILESPALSTASLPEQDEKAELTVNGHAAEEVAQDSAEEEKGSVDEKQSLEEETRGEKDDLFRKQQEEQSDDIHEVPEKLSQEQAVCDSKDTFPSDEEVARDLDNEFVQHKVEKANDKVSDLTAIAEIQHEEVVTEKLHENEKSQEKPQEEKKEEEKTIAPVKISSAIEAFGADIRETLMKTREMMMMGGMMAPKLAEDQTAEHEKPEDLTEKEDAAQLTPKEISSPVPSPREHESPIPSPKEKIPIQSPKERLSPEPSATLETLSTFPMEPSKSPKEGASSESTPKERLSPEPLQDEKASPKEHISPASSLKAEASPASSPKMLSPQLSPKKESPAPSPLPLSSVPIKTIQEESILSNDSVNSTPKEALTPIPSPHEAGSPEAQRKSSINLESESEKVSSPKSIESPIYSPKEAASPIPSPREAASPIPSPKEAASPIPSPKVASPIPSLKEAASPIPSPKEAASPIHSPKQGVSPIPSPKEAEAASPSPSPKEAASPIPSPKEAASPIPSPKEAVSPIPSPKAKSPVPSPIEAASPIPSPKSASPVPSPIKAASPIPSPKEAASPIPSPREATSPIPSPKSPRMLCPFEKFSTEAALKKMIIEAELPKESVSSVSSPGRTASPVPPHQEAPSPASSPKGAISPAPTPKESVSPVPTPKESVSPVPTPKDSASPVPTPKESVSPVPTPKESVSPVPTPKESTTPVPTRKESVSPIPTPKESVSPVSTPRDAASPVPTPKESVSPVPTPKESVSPIPTPKESVSPVSTPRDAASPVPTPKESVSPVQTPKESTTPAPTPKESISPVPTPKDSISPVPTPKESGSPPLSPKQLVATEEIITSEVEKSSLINEIDTSMTGIAPFTGVGETEKELTDITTDLKEELKAVKEEIISVKKTLETETTPEEKPTTHVLEETFDVKEPSAMEVEVEIEEEGQPIVFSVKTSEMPEKIENITVEALSSAGTLYDDKEAEKLIQPVTDIADVNVEILDDIIHKVAKELSEKDVLLEQKIEKHLEKDGSYSTAETLPMSEEVPALKKESMEEEKPIDTPHILDNKIIEEEQLEKHVLEKSEKKSHEDMPMIFTKEEVAPVKETPVNEQKYVCHHDYPKTPDEVADLPIDDGAAPELYSASPEVSQEEPFIQGQNNVYDNDVAAHELEEQQQHYEEQHVIHDVITHPEDVIHEENDGDEEEQEEDIQQQVLKQTPVSLPEQNVTEKASPVYTTLSADHAEVVALSEGTSPSTPSSPKLPLPEKLDDKIAEQKEEGIQASMPKGEMTINDDQGPDDTEIICIIEKSSKELEDAITQDTADVDQAVAQVTKTDEVTDDKHIERDAADASPTEKADQRIPSMIGADAKADEAEHEHEQSEEEEDEEKEETDDDDINEELARITSRVPVDPMSQSFYGEDKVFSEEVAAQDLSPALARYEKSPTGSASPGLSGDEQDKDEKRDNVHDVVRSPARRGVDKGDDFHRVTSLSELDSGATVTNDHAAARRSFSDDYSLRDQPADPMTQSFYDDKTKEENIFQTTQRMDLVGTQSEKVILPTDLEQTHIRPKDVFSSDEDECEPDIERKRSDELSSKLTISEHSPSEAKDKTPSPKQGKHFGQSEVKCFITAASFESEGDVGPSTATKSASPSQDAQEAEHGSRRSSKDMDKISEHHESDSSPPTISPVPSARDVSEEQDDLNDRIDLCAGDDPLDDELKLEDETASPLPSSPKSSTKVANGKSDARKDLKLADDDNKSQRPKSTSPITVERAEDLLASTVTKDTDESTVSSKQLDNLINKLEKHTTNGKIELHYEEEQPDSEEEFIARFKTNQTPKETCIIRRSVDSDDVVDPSDDNELESLKKIRSEEFTIKSSSPGDKKSELTEIRKQMATEKLSSSPQKIGEFVTVTSAQRATGYQYLCEEMEKGSNGHGSSDDEDNRSVKSGHSGREQIEGEFVVHMSPQRHIMEEGGEQYMSETPQRIYQIEEGGRNGVKPLVTHGGGHAADWEDDAEAQSRMREWDRGYSPEGQSDEDDDEYADEERSFGTFEPSGESSMHKDWVAKGQEQGEKQQSHGSESSGGSSPHGFEMDSPEIRPTGFDFPRSTLEERYLPDLKRHEVTSSSASSTQLSTPSSESGIFRDEKHKTPIDDWGEPMGLPSPPPPPSSEEVESPLPNGKPSTEKQRLTRVDGKHVGGKVDNKREKEQSSATGSPKKAVPAKAPSRDARDLRQKRPESPKSVTDTKKQAASKSPAGTKSGTSHFYVDLTYVPHHGNPHYSNVEFFKRVRARHYVFSGINPSKEVLNSLLEAKQTWEDKDLEVTIIPTYDTDTLGYWVALNEDQLNKCKIDLAPSASRCTINLQDHETSCSAYRLEF